MGNLERMPNLKKFTRHSLRKATTTHLKENGESLAEVTKKISTRDSLPRPPRMHHLKYITIRSPVDKQIQNDAPNLSPSPDTSESEEELPIETKGDVINESLRRIEPHPIKEPLPINDIDDSPPISEIFEVPAKTDSQKIQNLRTNAMNSMKRSRSMRRPSTRQQSSREQQSKVGIIKTLSGLIVGALKLILKILLLPRTKLGFYLLPGRWTAKNKVVLITGASSGIGAEIARQFAQQGASLALVARNHEELERVCTQCRDLGAIQVKVYSADLTNATSTQMAMKQAIVDYKKFDVVILSAGRGQGCYFEEIQDSKQIDYMIKLNVSGVITTLHYIIKHIPKSKSSRIVVISSKAGIVASPYQTVYGATKSALTGFCNSLRIELKNTYKKDSPAVCLINLQDVAGTKINSSRMDMGAKLRPVKWYSWAGYPLTQTVHELIPIIASGKREWSQTTKMTLWRNLYGFFPNIVDSCVLKDIQRTHYRPIDENIKHHRSISPKKRTRMNHINSF